MKRIGWAGLLAIVICCGTGRGLAATPQAQVLIQTQSCVQGKIYRPTNTFVAVFTIEQAAPLAEMEAERERLSKSLNVNADAAQRYFDYSEKFFENLRTRPALVRIKRMKGWRVRLDVPASSSLVVYGYLSEEGETEPQLIRQNAVPSPAKETVITLDYTDPVLCKWRGNGNPYAK